MMMKGRAFLIVALVCLGLFGLASMASAAGPIACFTAKPNPTYPEGFIVFDPRCSGHSEPFKALIRYEWEWNNDGVYDVSTATPNLVFSTFPCAVMPCTYPVTLRVTDDSDLTPMTDTFSLNIYITHPPHPPTAYTEGAYNTEGPYMVSLCSTDFLLLNGSHSYDTDEGQHEAGCNTCPYDKITAWGWDLTPPLTGFDDELGKIVTLNAADIAFYFPAAGTYDIGLRVTDNTALAYPTSGDPNLTDTDFGEVIVYPCGAQNLAARPKLTKIQLTWTHWGAASYSIYRSTAGPNSGFMKICGGLVTTYATYLDTSVVNGIKYYYRVVGSDGKASNSASATPTAR